MLHMCMHMCMHMYERRGTSGAKKMVVRSLYLPDSGVAGKCLTDQPNPSAPQEGVHVYHFVASLCSRKVRVMLALKGVAYESHHVVLPAYQQYEADYVRINPSASCRPSWWTAR